MTFGGPIHFIEPELLSKRKGVINKRLGKEAITTDGLHEQLLELRKKAIRNIKKNFSTFKKKAKENDKLTLHISKDPSEAVNYIFNETRNLELSRIDINRSNTIRTLEPYLHQKGFEVVHTYNHAIKSGNLGVFDNVEPGYYWTLSELELENKFQSFNRNPKPIAYTRELISRSTSKGDFIGVLGANVFSTTGEIFAVQHLYNITSILTHAKQSFLVLTLDKLVGSYSDALFQARCTAMYGLEQIILDLFDVERLKGKLKGKKVKKSKKTAKSQTIDKNYYERYQPPENLHIIILDDARMKLLGSNQEDLLFCIGCRKCGLLCPRIRVGRQKPDEVKDLTQVSFTLTARELLMDGILHGPERAIENGLFDCTLCRSCSITCPLGIELTDHIQKMRESCQKSDLFAAPHKRIRNNILKVGNAYGSDYTMKASIHSRGRK